MQQGVTDGFLLTSPCASIFLPRRGFLPKAASLHDAPLSLSQFPAGFDGGRRPAANPAEHGRCAPLLHERAGACKPQGRQRRPCGLQAPAARTAQGSSAAGSKPRRTSATAPSRRAPPADADAPAFGPRLAKLRKEAGYTQVEFAQAVGVSQRMVAYYEAPEAMPPAHLLPAMSQVLGVSADVLLGTAPTRRAAKVVTSRLERRLQQIEKLDAAEKRQILQLIDAFIERSQLRRKVQQG
ncbi:helix-turn-helix domain-containing protein [Paraburkholderia sacchari]|uniref:helix-turn-helix domain-containing protein n=1 Tax=Paraburkholderia sacchari TaxID=159450 RepID=UPI003D95D3AD